MVVLPREVDDYGSAYRWRRLGESDGDIVSLHSLSIADTDPQKRVLFHFSFILGLHGEKRIGNEKDLLRLRKEMLFRLVPV